MQYAQEPYGSYDVDNAVCTGGLWQLWSGQCSVHRSPMAVMIWTVQCAQEPYGSYDLDSAVCTGALWQLWSGQCSVHGSLTAFDMDSWLKLQFFLFPTLFCMLYLFKFRCGIIIIIISVKSLKSNCTTELQTVTMNIIKEHKMIIKKSNSDIIGNTTVVRLCLSVINWCWLVLCFMEWDFASII
jgi:hypothetical protein